VLNLDAYRDEADRFTAALDEEYYLHYSGRQERFDLAPIYERHAGLATLEACADLREAGAVALWRFACEGYLGSLTRADEEELARLEATLAAEVDGEEIPFRMLRPVTANEPDRDRRARLDAARIELAETRLQPVYRAMAERVNDAVPELGAPTYRELYLGFGLRLEELAGQCRAFLADTEDLYLRTFDTLLRDRLGVPLVDVRRWDLARLFRATEWDEGFPADRMMPALTATLADLGIDLQAQRNVHLDLDDRPLTSPRAFCAPIEVPGRVMLVIKPIGGADDWRALFHEAGHTEHFAHTSSSLSMEARRLGDNGVTEGWAALFERLVDEPAWLARRLDFGSGRVFAADMAVKELYIARRYCAKLLYELELHAGGVLDDMRPRYVELLADATKIEPAAADFLADVDDAFYVSCYLRSWALEAQLRGYLREQFGNAWFARREAGSLLRELWHEGQSMDAEELLRQVAGEELDLGALVGRIEEALA
jgi:hypothetical protein